MSAEPSQAEWGCAVVLRLKDNWSGRRAGPDAWWVGCPGSLQPPAIRKARPWHLCYRSSGTVLHRKDDTRSAIISISLKLNTGDVINKLLHFINLDGKLVRVPLYFGLESRSQYEYLQYMSVSHLRWIKLTSLWLHTAWMYHKQAFYLYVFRWLAVRGESRLFREHCRFLSVRASRGVAAAKYVFYVHEFHAMNKNTNCVHGSCPRSTTRPAPPH